MKQDIFTLIEHINKNHFGRPLVYYKTKHHEFKIAVGRLSPYRFFSKNDAFNRYSHHIYHYLYGVESKDDISNKFLLASASDQEFKKHLEEVRNYYANMECSPIEKVINLIRVNNLNWEIWRYADVSRPENKSKERNFDFYVIYGMNNERLRFSKYNNEPINSVKVIKVNKPYDSSYVIPLIRGALSISNTPNDHFHRVPESAYYLLEGMPCYEINISAKSP